MGRAAGRRFGRPAGIAEKGTLMTTDSRQVPDTNAAVIAEFRANKGEVPAPYDDPPPMLLIHTIGARSGREHVVPMRCLPDGDTLYIFGSAHGSERHPDWYYNIIAHPDITIEKGTESIEVHATEVHDEEREAIFARQAARFPIFAEYERRLRRTIPVIRLDSLAT
jgi:deazaflavin-dependent oxidoreductase (nitroreductase family)